MGQQYVKLMHLANRILAI